MLSEILIMTNTAWSHSYVETKVNVIEVEENGGYQDL
jgi:hypothetical protein